MTQRSKRALIEAASGDYEAFGFADKYMLMDRWSDTYEEMYENQYDKLMPKLFKKIMNKIGFKDVELTRANLDGTTTDVNKERRISKSKKPGIWMTELTEEMKDKINDGLPLFSRRAGKNSANATGGITLGSKQPHGKSFAAV